MIVKMNSLIWPPVSSGHKSAARVAASGMPSAHFLMNLEEGLRVEQASAESLVLKAYPSYTRELAALSTAAATADGEEGEIGETTSPALLKLDGDIISQGGVQHEECDRMLI
jgi:hypothetical protein